MLLYKLSFVNNCEKMGRNSVHECKRKHHSLSPKDFNDKKVDLRCSISRVEVEENGTNVTLLDPDKPQGGGSCSDAIME